MDGPPRTDVDLLAAVVDRDEAALGELYQRHAGWLSARLRRRCGDDDIVADVLQDTFVAVWKGAHRFRGEADVAAWIWGISMRRLVSRLRGQGAERLGSALSTRPIRPAQPAVEQSAEELVLLAVEHSDVGAALGRVPPELRVVLQATVLDGLTTREAAHLLGIPQGTVKTRMARARAVLREELT